MTRKYDLYSQEFHQHSHEVFERMRQDDPVFQQPGLLDNILIWFVTRYTEVEQVLLNVKVFVHDPHLALPPDQVATFMGSGDPRIDEMLNNHMLNKEGADHRRLRSLVSKAFTPAVIQSLRLRIQEIASQLIDAVEPQGRMDLISDYAYPLPITVIAELLGIPVADQEKFRRWSNAFVKPALTPQEQHESQQLLIEMAAYMLEQVEIRRQAPRPDLLTGLIHAEEQGDRLSQGELFSMLSLLVVAGHETTVSFIGNAVLALLQHPAELERLKRHPSEMAAAIDELLRFDSPVERALTRWVAHDTELGGQQLKRGDLVIAVPGSANRDGERFENPAELRLGRQPNPHLAFGKGRHYCLGAPLARLEGEIALNTLFQRLPGVQLDAGPAALQWRQVPLFHSLVCLPLRWPTP